MTFVPTSVPERGPRWSHDWPFIIPYSAIQLVAEDGLWDRADVSTHRDQCLCADRTSRRVDQPEPAAGRHHDAAGTDTAGTDTAGTDTDTDTAGASRTDDHQPA